MTPSISNMNLKSVSDFFELLKNLEISSKIRIDIADVISSGTDNLVEWFCVISYITVHRAYANHVVKSY